MLTDPITPERPGVAANSCAIKAPRSFLASSSRSITSIFILAAPTSTPPELLISVMASFAPSRMDTPIGAEPPVNGPVMASLMLSAANVERARRKMSRGASQRIMTRSPLGKPPERRGRGSYHES